MANIPTTNNNPGDLRFIGQPGAVQSPNGFAKFPTPQAGFQALQDDLQYKITKSPKLGPNATLQDFANVYAPASDGNDPVGYAQKLASQMGTKVESTLGSLTGRIGAFAKAVANNEGWQGGTAYADTVPSQSNTSQDILAQKIKAKYPQYNDIPDAQLEEKVLAKYPQYADMASGNSQSGSPSSNTETQGGLPITPLNVPQAQDAQKSIPVGSAGQSLGTPDPSKNPLSFATGITNGLGLKGATDTFGQDIAAASNPDLRQKGLLPFPGAEQNIGAVAQTAGMVGTLAAAPETLGGAMLAGGLGGAAISGGQAMTQNASAQQVAQKGTIGGLGGAGTAGLLAGAGKALGAIGDKIQFAEIKPVKADIEDGFSLASMKKHGIGGTLNQVEEQTQTKLAALQSELTNKLSASNATINLNGVLNQTAEDLNSPALRGALKTFGSNQQLGGALEHLQGEVKALDPSLSIPDAQIVKQAAGKKGAWLFNSNDPDASAREVVYNTFYRNLKTSIEDASPPGVKDINKQMSELIPIQNAVIRRIPIAQRNNPISLTDFIGLAASAAHPAPLGPTLLNFMSKSGAVGNVLSKYAPKIGQIAAPKIGGALGGTSGFLTPPTTTSP